MSSPLGSSVHRRAGSSPVTRTIKIDNTLVLSIFIIPAKRWQDLKVTVKKTVRWTVFREGVDAPILAYLCLISEVDSSERRKYVTRTKKKRSTLVLLFFFIQQAKGDRTWRWRKNLENKKTHDTWQQGLTQLLYAVRENKPFIVNVYNCVDKGQVEKYLKPLTDDLLLGVVEEESINVNVREEVKRFIAQVYSYCFVGIIIWKKNRKI